jgi:hypothetical protein
MSKPARLSGIFLAAATWLVGATALAAPREYQVFRTDHPPVIDGDLRDDIWRAVPWSGDFTGFQGAKADVQTQFAMAWDEKFLYVAVRCKEPNPEAIHAGIAGPDLRIVNDDHIEILLASPDQPTTYFQIFINPGRGRMDQRIEDEKEKDGPGYDHQPLRLGQAGLDLAARVQAGEWVLEVAIPLPKVEFPLKEGLTYVGNVCRVRPAGAVKEMAWNPAHGELRKSADFGVFKLSGLAPKADPIQGGDVVCLRNGDVVNGSLLRLADGKIQLSSPTFAEGVSFSATEAQRLDLAWTQADAAPARFCLSDGAEISGRIVSLSADTVGIESPSLGRISIPRGALSRISFSGFAVESHFEAGILKPWEVIAETCDFSGGVMRLSNEKRPGQISLAVLSLPLHQDKIVTLIAECDPQPGSMGVQIELLADRAHPQMQIQNGVLLHIFEARGPNASSGAALNIIKDGQPLLPVAGARRIEPLGEHVRIKATYNPANGAAKLWLNGKLAAEAIAPDGPRQGEYVVFGATRPLTVRRLAVYCGLPASDEPPAGLKPGEILADLSNGDVVRASQIEFVDGNFVFTTEFSPMKVSPDRVLSIAFPASAEKAPTAEGAAWVETSGSRFGMEVRAITDESVIGRSPELGEVKLQRRMVKSIAFPAP